MGDGGPAISAWIYAASGVAVDSGGNVLITDTYNDRVRMVAATTCAGACPYGLPYTTKGDIYTIAGNGTAGYSGDGGPATSAELYSPEGLVVDGAGNVLIADSGNGRIRLVAAATCASSCAYGLASMTTGDIYTIAGDGAIGYSGDDGPATSAQIDGPTGLAIEGTGNVLIADSGNSRIRMVSAATCASSCAYGLASTTTGDIYTIAGNGTQGYSGDGGPAVSAEIAIRYTGAVVTDAAGDLFIADSHNNRVREVQGSLAVAVVAPSGGPASGGTAVTITGAGFGGVTAVDFGMTPASAYRVVGPDEIMATAPPGSPGSVDVTVVTPGATSPASASDRFTYDPGIVPTPSNPLLVAADPQTDTWYVTNISVGTLSVIDGATMKLRATVQVGEHPLGVAVDQETDTIYVANQGSNSLSVVNGTTNRVSATVVVGASPIDVAVDPIAHKAFVTNFGDSSVSVVNETTNTVKSTIRLAAAPVGIAVDPGTRSVYVTELQANSLAVLSEYPNGPEATVPTGSAPLGVTVDAATGTVFVANSASDTLSVVNAATNTVSATVRVGSVPAVPAVDPSTDRVYVSDFTGASVSIVDGSTNTLSATVPLSADAAGIDVDPITGTLLVAEPTADQVEAIAETSGEVATTVVTPSSPSFVAVDPATGRWYVSDSSADALSVVNGATRTVSATIPVGIHPLGVAVDPTTGTVYVANEGSNSLSIVDGATNAVSATVAIGQGPIDVAVDSITHKVFVTNYGGSSVSVVDETTDAVTATIALAAAPVDVALDSVTGTVYVTETSANLVAVISESTDALVTTIPVGTSPLGLAVAPTADALYVTNSGSNSVSMIDATTNTVSSTESVGTDPVDVAVDPASSYAYVTNFGSATMSVLYTGRNGSLLWSGVVLQSAPLSSNPLGVAFDGTNHMVAVAEPLVDVVQLLGWSAIFDLIDGIIEADADYTQDGGAFGNSSSGFTIEMQAGETSFTYADGDIAVTSAGTVGVAGAQCDPSLSATQYYGTQTSGPSMNCQTALLDAWSPVSDTCYYAMVMKAVPSGPFTEQGATVTSAGTYYAANSGMTGGCTTTDLIHSGTWSTNGFPAPS